MSQKGPLLLKVAVSISCCIGYVTFVPDSVTSLMKDDMAFAERLPVDMKEGNGDVAIVMGTKVVVGAVGTFIIFGGGVDTKS